jgi:hypothetical protein
MEHILPREANSFLTGSKYFLHFMETEGSLQHLTTARHMSLS